MHVSRIALRRCLRLTACAALCAMTLSPSLAAAKDAAVAPVAASPASGTPYVRPDVKAYLEAMRAAPRPELTREMLEKIRQMPPSAMAAMSMGDLPVGELAVQRDVEMRGPAGQIRLRLYDIRAERGASPVVVFYHGGGFVVGSIDTHDGLAAEIARRLDLPVVSVEYRLAPENPWPAALDDGEAAARWIAANAKAFEREFTGLVLSGDSAGGNITLITAAALRDKPAALPVVMQLPIYPVTDFSKRYASHDLFGNGYGLDSSSIDLFTGYYAADPENQRASPLLGDLAGLPPTVLVTASLDPLRDEGRAYAAGLVEAGVPTSYYEGKGLIHGFATYRKAIPSAQEDTVTFLHLARAMLEGIESD
ncbi:hypothetical protein GCM10011494_24860 [Novosphingobium endophyticum]|uniref:Alpha/beta hydrolase fold-3 domain-containing protein n=1 Tax=Novosphingobium endophyticum TaxID=1955250 RepID=A0A916X614_9SPHN|nr:alpha/beta hydrolase [Novosphingobium endophyticum]GGC05331.1 hypothetical protein GCM10011494_24860 [Novosphingobium endophyticum]